MLITLTTDFGVSSPYVAAMKGALLSVCPAAQLIDITHAISPQNVRQAAVVLADVTPFFPRGTLHVAVIDPGVGTERRILYAEIGEQRYLAPDNGLLSYLPRTAQPKYLVEVAAAKFWRTPVSNTFHGRDIFAPVAGHLASGVSPHDLGPVTNQMIDLKWPEAQYGEEVLGEVLYVDSFGNLITNIAIADLRIWLHGSQPTTRLRGHSIFGLRTTYGNTDLGQLIALGDSQGRFEIAIVQGNAAETLGVKSGDMVAISRSDFAASPQSIAPQKS